MNQSKQQYQIAVSLYISSISFSKCFLALNLFSLKVGVTRSLATEKGNPLKQIFFILSIPLSLYSAAFASISSNTAALSSLLQSGETPWGKGCAATHF
ncbi:hypothetical protein FGO68_gene13969 [Halteria grandinella]|uniref:Uncharacterized protein n=1 Tax=Halteria grandinella TaxID=5974 RepID=A0A8J8NCV4_HALGN|nr:hypothetical protein FGO68_gene13969 [Halteria grandinella]